MATKTVAGLDRSVQVVALVNDAQPTTAGSYVQITGLATFKTLTPPADATKALIIVSGQPVRWRADGTTPTASIGMPVAVGASLVLHTIEMAAVRFIETAASATLDVYFSK